MSASFLIETRDGVTKIRLTAELELDDLRNAVDQIAAEAHEQSHLRLWDLSAGLHLTEHEVRAIAEHGSNKWSVPSRVAYLAPNDLTFGILRMLEVYGERDSLQTRVFRDEKEAISWLKQETDC